MKVVGCGPINVHHYIYPSLSLSLCMHTFFYVTKIIRTFLCPPVYIEYEHFKILG